MKKAFLILSVLLLSTTAFAGILQWGAEAIPKGKVKTIKCYLISLGDSAKCCSDPVSTQYFDMAGRKIAEDVVIMDSKSNISYEYDNLNRLKKKITTSWETHYYYNDSSTTGKHQLIKDIRYPLGSTHPTETIFYSYKGNKLTQFKSYNEYRENYTCIVTDSNSIKIERYSKEGKLSQKDETRYYANGSIAMINEHYIFDDDNMNFYNIEQYTYGENDKEGNWVKCKVVGNLNNKPIYWLYVREIEYYQ